MFTDLFANAPMTNVTFFWQKHSNTHQRLNSSPHMPKKDHHTHSTMILQKYTNSDLRVTVMTCLKKITNSRVSCYTQEHLNRSQHYKFWYIPQQSNKISTTHLVQRRYSFSFFFQKQFSCFLFAWTCRDCNIPNTLYIFFSFNNNKKHLNSREG